MNCEYCNKPLRQNRSKHCSTKCARKDASLKWLAKNKKGRKQDQAPAVQVINALPEIAIP